MKKYVKWNFFEHAIFMKLKSCEWKRLYQKFESPEDLKNKETIRDYVSYCIGVLMEDKETRLEEIASAQGRMQKLSELLGWTSIITDDFIANVVKDNYMAWYIEGHHAPDLEKIKWA